MDQTPKTDLSTSPHPRSRPSDLDALRRRKAEIEARIAAAEAKAKEADRKARTRRAIILGEAVLTAIERGQLAAASGGVWVPISDAAEWIAAQPLRPQDRAAWAPAGAAGSRPSRDPDPHRP